MTGNAPPSIQEATELLRQRQIVLREVPGAYTVNFRDGRPATEYRTEDLDEALAHGPMGKGSSQRGKMIAHNRKLPLAAKSATQSVDRLRVSTPIGSQQ